MKVRYLVGDEPDIPERFEGEVWPTIELQRFRSHCLAKQRFGLYRVGGVGLQARKTEDDGLVGPMADAGEGKRSEQLDLDTAGLLQPAGLGRFLQKAAGDPHRANRVRA